MTAARRFEPPLKRLARVSRKSTSRSKCTLSEFTPQILERDAYWKAMGHNEPHLVQPWRKRCAHYVHVFVPVPDNVDGKHDNDRGHGSGPDKHHHPIQPFLVNPYATYATYDVQGVDAGLWYNGTTYPLLVAYLNETSVFVPWGDVGLGWVTDLTTRVHPIFSVPQGKNASGLRFGAGDVGIFTLMPPKAE